MLGIDVVNGVVIGDYTIEVRLYSPRGTEEGRCGSCSTETEAREWAENLRAKKISEVGESCAKWLGWDKPWEMRIYG